MRKLTSYIRKYGRVDGEKLYRTLQREAAFASAAARLKKKLSDHSRSCVIGESSPL